MWHRAIWKGHPMRLELIRKGLLVELANHYTTKGDYCWDRPEYCEESGRPDEIIRLGDSNRSLNPGQKTRSNNSYEVPTIRFQTFFVRAILLKVHTWNSCPLPAAMYLLYRSSNFWKAPWKSSSVSVLITFVTASLISSIVS